eukprot:281550-Pleurochrysis_carterae.AAC.1
MHTPPNIVPANVLGGIQGVARMRKPSSLEFAATHAPGLQFDQNFRQQRTLHCTLQVKEVESMSEGTERVCDRVMEAAKLVARIAPPASLSGTADGDRSGISSGAAAIGRDSRASGPRLAAAPGSWPSREAAWRSSGRVARCCRFGAQRQDGAVTNSSSGKLLADEAGRAIHSV